MRWGFDIPTRQITCTSPPRTPMGWRRLRSKATSSLRRISMSMCDILGSRYALWVGSLKPALLLSMRWFALASLNILKRDLLFRRSLIRVAGDDRSVILCVPSFYDRKDKRSTRKYGYYQSSMCRNSLVFRNLKASAQW